VTGAADVRLYELCADPLLWLGISRIHTFVTSSGAKTRAVQAAGIEIIKTVKLPASLLPPSAIAEANFKEERSKGSFSNPVSPLIGSNNGPPVPPAPLLEGPASPRRSGAPAHRFVSLTSHAAQFSVSPLPVRWGAAEPASRGAVVATLAHPQHRNAIGTHNGPYAVYRAVGIAKQIIDPSRPLDLQSTEPVVTIGPYPSWYNADAIVALDPWGAMVSAPDSALSAAARARGVSVQPSIAISRFEARMPEIVEALREGRLSADGTILREGGVVSCIKASIEPVWHLPGVARRFKLDEEALRRKLFEHTGGMFPELVTRADLEIFLPPIGGCTVLIFGDEASIPDTSRPLVVRVHDECNGSDVFGSDICTCRPYLLHGIEECVRAAQAGGAGVIVYNRKEGRALGEVTKFMVYNARKRQAGGDSAQNYFKRTRQIAGVEDMRFQELMPDPLLWLGVRKIDRFISMSDMKYDAVVGAGIEIVTRVDIPEELIPADAKVEIDAKMYAGYYAGDKQVKSWEELNQTVGRKATDDEAAAAAAAAKAAARAAIAGEKNGGREKGLHLSFDHEHDPEDAPCLPCEE